MIQCVFPKQNWPRTQWQLASSSQVLAARCRLIAWRRLNGQIRYLLQNMCRRFALTQIWHRSMHRLRELGHSSLIQRDHSPHCFCPSAKQNDTQTGNDPILLIHFWIDWRFERRSSDHRSKNTIVESFARCREMVGTIWCHSYQTVLMRPQDEPVIWCKGQILCTAWDHED